MSKKLRAPWPPQWVDEAARRGVDPVTFAGSVAGSVELQLWKAIGKVTQVELGWAMRRASPLQMVPSNLLPHDIGQVARVTALRTARSGFAHVSNTTWQQLVFDIAPALSANAMADPQAIIAAVERRIEAIAEIVGREPVGAAPERVARDLTRSQIRRAAADVRRERDGHPSKAEVAGRLHTSESTLKRAMRDLGMAAWPPEPPKE